MRYPLLGAAAAILALLAAQPSEAASKATVTKLNNKSAQPKGIDTTNTIRFDEYRNGTDITTQYIKNGVDFSSEDVMIFDCDYSSCLSSIHVEGPVAGRFVQPNSTTQATVSAFSFDTNETRYEDTIRVAWYDKNGNELNNYTTGAGRNHFVISSSANDIASFRLTYIGSYDEDKDTELGIDNLSFKLPPSGPPDVAGNTGTTATVATGPDGVQGKFDFAGDSDWYKLSLTSGSFYALRFTQGSSATGSVTLRDQSGNSLVTFAGDPSWTTGKEYKASRTGTYFLDAKNATLPNGPASYVVGFAGDCASSLTDACALTVGTTQSRSFAFYKDLDVYKVQLTKGVAYRAVINDSGAGGVQFLEVRNPSNTVVASGSRSGSLYQTGSFKPTVTGTFSLRVQNNAEPFPYTVLVKKN